jgi:hypothetical protein
VEVTRLLVAGVPVDAVDVVRVDFTFSTTFSASLTALMWAIRKGETDTVALLLDKGANIDATSSVRIPEHTTVF